MIQNVNLTAKFIFGIHSDQKSLIWGVSANQDRARPSDHGCINGFSRLVANICFTITNQMKVIAKNPQTKSNYYKPYIQNRPENTVDYKIGSLTIKYLLKKHFKISQ